jgi:hypothetical protein
MNCIVIIIIILGEPQHSDFINDNCIKIIYVNFIKKRVKHIITTCGLKTLFFALSTSIPIIDGICDVRKDEIGISVSFFVKKLMVEHMSTFESRHVS